MISRIQEVLRALSLIVCLLLACSCSTSDDSTSMLRPEGLSMFSGSTLSDWKTWADQVSVVVVEDEERLPPEGATTGRFIYRTLTLDVETDVWSRHASTSQVTVRTYGWWESSDKPMRKMGPRKGARLELGASYLVALLRDADGEWSLLGAAPAIPINESNELEPAEKSGAFFEGLDGMSVADLTTRFASVAADPLAEKYSDYDAVSRGKLMGFDQADAEGKPIANSDALRAKLTTTTMPSS